MPSYPQLGSDFTKEPPLSVNQSASAKKNFPNPFEVRKIDQQTFDELGCYKTSMDILPPLSTTDTIVLDDGNCRSSFMKSTFYKVPATKELANQSGIPLGLSIQPFASVNAEIPQVDCTSPGSLLRCRNCMAYVNPFIIVNNGGRSYRCNICSMDNNLPPDLYSLGSQSKPELRYGTVDFLVANEFIKRATSQRPPFLIFLVDVTKTEFIPLFIDSIKHSLNFLNEGVAFSNVGIAAFDRSLHLIDFSHIGSPSIVTYSDLEDPFSGVFLKSFCIPAKGNCSSFSLILDSFTQIFERSTRNDSCLGSALRVLLRHVSEVNCRIITFSSSFFGFGPGSLRLREASANASEKEFSLFKAQGTFIKDVANEAANSGVCIDLFIANSSPCDVASIEPLASLTGGEVHLYSGLSSRNAECLREDVFRKITSSIAFDCFGKLRVSEGISVQDYFGNLNMRNASEMMFGGFDVRQAFSVLLSVDAKLAERSKVSFQYAILFTDTFGRRVVRVHNLCLPLASSISELFLFSDFESVTSLLSKRAASLVMNETLSGIRSLISKRVASILYAYRKYCSPNSLQSQLVLPDAQKILPILSLGLQKSRAFTSMPLSLDSRVCWLKVLSGLPLESLQYLLYPKLLCCTDFSNASQFEQQEIPLSSEFLDPQHVYCLFSGVSLFLWVGKLVSPQILASLFKVSSLEELDTHEIRKLPVIDNDLSAKTRALIDCFQKDFKNFRHSSLVICRQGIDASEGDFATHLIHDQAFGLPSYADYLASLHNLVKEEHSK